LNRTKKYMNLWIIIALVMIALFNHLEKRSGPETNISYTEFLDMVGAGEIRELVMQGQVIFGSAADGRRFKVFTPRDINLLTILKQQGVEIRVKPPAKPARYMSLLISLLPMILLVGVWIYFMRQMQTGGGSVLSFGKSRARLLSDNSEKVTFEDVAGIDEVKEELGEIIDFLKEPAKYTRLGGRIPKGVLLMGSPGTGKTLLARAIAGEADVPFFHISGSDFVEMFVGVGASRVRDLFIQGKKNAPCIIFIDEIDAVGRQRGTGLGGGHDEREQTLNQLLVEMDGFESNEGVILISATNRPDVLDPALLRPGRFDRQVVISLPDILGREKILEVHMKKIPVASGFKIDTLAKGTPGFSGADLENLVNEAALLAAKRNKNKVDTADFEESKDKVFMGLERKSKVISAEDKKTTAYHEGGHALVARLLPDTDAVNKITIIPRGRSLGITWFLPEENEFKYKAQLESELVVALGGRMAEVLVFDRISTAAAEDIRQATELARKMVCAWGMSETLGPLSYSQGNEQIFLGREIAQHRDYSEETARKIDEEIEGLIMKNRDRARLILENNMDILHTLTGLLLEKETVTGQELDDLICSMRPGISLPANRN
jgi:cell division protease FtsH